MKTLKVTIHPLSDLIMGDVNADALIDAQTEVTLAGFPYLRGKTFKGLLRESMQEVCEIMGKSHDRVDKLLGVGGNDSGKLRFDNFYLEDWNTIKDEWQKNKQAPAMHRSVILNYFTRIIPQTALDDDGVAKKGSLRNYRVLKPGFPLTAQLKATEQLDPEEEDLITKSLLNILRIGLRRNRDFGRVSIEFGDWQEMDSATSASFEGRNLTRVKVTLKTLSPAIMGVKLGDQNTVSSLNYIPGTKIAGVLKKYLPIKRNELHFSNLFYKGLRPLGLHWQKEKLSPSNLHNVYIPDGKRPQTIAIKGLYDGATIPKDHVPVKEQFFHNSRNKSIDENEVNPKQKNENRLAGKSTDGGLFYYEALDVDQSFTGFIEAPTGSLDALPQTLTAYIGRSKSAQYGHVQLSFEEAEEPSAKITGTKIIATVESPLTLLNANGFPELSKETLANALKIDKTQIENTTPSFTEIDAFVTPWQVKAGNVPAYDVGTSFLIETKDAKEWPEHLFIGYGQERGLGCLRMEKFDKNAKLDQKLDDNTNPNTTQEYTFSNEVLQDISIRYTKGQQNIKLKHNAVRKALTHNGSASGSLIQQLLTWFSDRQDKEDFNRKVNELADKDIGRKKLKQASFIDEDDKFRFDLVGLRKEASWGDVKLAWNMFLETLRKRNKQNNK